jgi:hypothetical protein
VIYLLQLAFPVVPPVIAAVIFAGWWQRERVVIRRGDQR